MSASFLRRTFWPRNSSGLWSATEPVREELFGPDRLELHAFGLALAQKVTKSPPAVLPLQSRLDDNAAAVLAAYCSSARDVVNGQAPVPAAEWLLDNYHIVDKQMRQIREDLPPGYYRQLPKLAEGTFAGYPRVFGLAWAFIAHTDSHFDPETLRRFVTAYQRVQPLTIGELWAIAISLRIVLVENLRRLAEQIVTGQREREEADMLADSLLARGEGQSAAATDFLTRSSPPLSDIFSAQLAKRFRDQDPGTTPALSWFNERLRQQGTTIDEMVQRAQQKLGASNVTVRNVITSMGLISQIDWADLVESVSLVDAELRSASNFAAMDFPTRNLYRNAIEELAFGSALAELEITGHVLEATRTAARNPHGSGACVRQADPGYHLIGAGRPALERTIGFRPRARARLSRALSRMRIGGYVGLLLAIAIIFTGLGTLALGSIGAGWLVLFAALAFLPATEVATTFLNRTVAGCLGARVLPGLELADGIPQALRTLVAVPTLLTSIAEIEEQVERLEVHHLAGSGGDLTFALLTDGVDADEAVLASDTPLLAAASQAIARLNAKYGPGLAGDRFLLLHRRRRYNESEQKWMGWERKRGKLHELNRLLRGAADTSFIPAEGRPVRVPGGVRFVITLDADTRLPREAARRLVGKLAHPLNRPEFDPELRRVTAGHAILQPRITPTLPLGGEGSIFQGVAAGPAGLDPYAAAISDHYQDLFGEGSYTGKGIYNVDAFEAALCGRVPENTMLSHDLFEGIFARAGLVSDIELVEDFPVRYEVASRREHRWTRGDWQLLPWLSGRAGAVPPLGRWKMLDNLRRSLIAPFTLMTLALSWLFPMPAALAGIVFILVAAAVPAFFHGFFALVPNRAGIRLRNHLGMLGQVLRQAAAQFLFSVIFLPDRAWQNTDAIARTLIRLFVTRRNLLEWTTAARSAAAPRLGLYGFYRKMAGETLFGLALTAAALALAPGNWPLILPFALLWACAPALAFHISRPTTEPQRRSLTAAEAEQFRLTARRTWRFFETFVTASDNMLPPDNFQEDPEPVLARRTSPTNIGLYLLATVVARDFGWAGLTETVERLEATFASMRKLARFKGHFFNWYDTQDLRVLEPAYVSSVDSGNLAGHLIALANSCEEWVEDGPAPDVRTAFADLLELAREALQAIPAESRRYTQQITAIFNEIETLLHSAHPIESDYTPLTLLLEKLAGQIAAGGENEGGLRDVAFWIGAMQKARFEHARDHESLADGRRKLNARLQVIAQTAREMAMAMDFAFLLDPERKLLSIGYSMADNGLDTSCYDLLASEARLASLFAIAKGDVPTRHWFRLGRSATPLGSGSALISWSGSMFEYLMPSLIMRAPVGSLLEQTNRLVVRRQKAYGRSLGIPWGISESAYHARDFEFTYQYSNFGVPGLGLKRGLAADAVIAPYATALAAMIDPRGAHANFKRLASMGARCRYGFYEALDFTRTRLPAGENVAIVRAFMAHHQGMSIIALANLLQDGRMRARFHREPMIRATELLLQERIPGEIAVLRQRSVEEITSGASAISEREPARRLAAAMAGPPKTHLLSNGRYAVMLTTTGAGYSRWKDIAVSRWREDAVRDDWGAFVFLKDCDNGRTWTGGGQSSDPGAEMGEVYFGEDSARFIVRQDTLTSTMEVLVSGEDDAEARRIGLTNNGRRPREVELTTYWEVVLADPAADDAHPAFSKLFVQTELLASQGALAATRRPRTPDEPRVWAAHFGVVEGEEAAETEYETDRTRFLGRGRSLADAAALMDGLPLSGTVGTVLDPIFSLRKKVIVPPGKMVRVTFWTLIAETRAELLALIDMHLDRSAFDRARTRAWTQAQVQLRHLGIDAAEAADFQRLAAPLLYADARFRAAPATILRGAGPQSGLWPHSISGDAPIVVLGIDDIHDMAQVGQLLRAHEYWRLKRLAVDLVIINEHAASYIQDLQIAIEAAVRTRQLRTQLGDPYAKGSVHVLRADLMSVEARALLAACARVVLHARLGPIAEQLARLYQPESDPAPVRRQKAAASPAPPRPAAPGLEFFNGIGGFDKNGREYVTILHGSATTPAPWINVVANSGFGFQVSATGAGYTWADNSRENQLTQWSNDPVTDPSGEALYVRDEITGELWSPTAQPMRDGGTYVARHGFGYSRFEHETNGIALDLLQFVPLSDPVKVSRLRLCNVSTRPRRLSVTAYAEWVLGTARGASAPFIVTGMDGATGAILARNPWSTAFPGRVAFADLGGSQTGWTADRGEFLGRGGSPAAPAALLGKDALAGVAGAGVDPCAALSTTVELGVGESADIVWLLGQSGSAQEARALILRYRDADPDALLSDVTGHWDRLLGTVQVKTPDRAMDIMLNGWLLYQTLACRIMARSAFYQASGAYGFRDQLQDGMALSFAAPEETRRHLLRAASRQFVEGDMQHWWLPHSGQGVRTRISDDRVWLAFAAASYVRDSGDSSVLDEDLPFLEGPHLEAGAHDTFLQPMIARRTLSAHHS